MNEEHVEPTTPSLPATIPNLLRKGSPVLVRCNDDDGADVFVAGLYCMPDPRWDPTKPDDCGAWGPHIIAPVDAWPETGDDMHRSCRDDEVFLDLNDITGRAHAAWRVFGVAPDGTPPAVYNTPEPDGFKEVLVRAATGLPVDAAKLRAVALRMFELEGR